MPITIRGTGRVEIPAYGVADAEATVEKELKSIFPRADVDIRQVRRMEPKARIVETFEISFTLRVSFEIDPAEDGHEKARRRAFSAGRRALDGTRYERIVWQSP